MFKPLKILLVEDNPGDAYFIKEYLDEYENIHIDHIKTLHSTLETLKEEKYDLLILDLYLPLSKGVNTYTTIKKQYPEQKIIVMSSQTEELHQNYKGNTPPILDKNNLTPEILIETIKNTIPL